jgi:enoyl-[acyl-carrier protein] reductase II
MENRLTKLLQIKHPILQGGMALSSDAKLAAAVSNAGGAGIIGMGSRTTEWLRAEVRKAKSLTSSPFGVNLMLMTSNVQEFVDVICEEEVSFVTTGAGNPVPWIKIFHAAGVKVLPVVPNVKLAKRVEEAGVDAIIIEGMEAGGHVGWQTTMALLSNVIPEIKIPVVAAGGIADGRGMAAAMVMGASGVQMGSRFLISTESPAHPDFKQMIINATDTDSVVTGYSRNTGVRCVRNPFTDKYLAREIAGAPQQELNDMATGTNRDAAIYGDLVNGSVQAGQSLNLLKKIEPCADIIDEIMRDVTKILAEAHKIAL